WPIMKAETGTMDPLRGTLPGLLAEEAPCTNALTKRRSVDSGDSRREFHPGGAPPTESSPDARTDPRRRVMTWINEYRRKVCGLERAVEAVRSGDRVWVQPGCATPEPLVRALTARATALRDVEIVHMMTLGGAPYAEVECEGSFR